MVKQGRCRTVEGLHPQPGRIRRRPDVHRVGGGGHVAAAGYTSRVDLDSTLRVCIKPGCCRGAAVVTANRRRRDSGATGFVFIDKPSGCTSHDVVARARKSPWYERSGTRERWTRWPPVSRVGRRTRDKAARNDLRRRQGYLADIRLGVSTHTDDQQGEVTSRMSAGRNLSEEQVRAGMSRFVGRIAQRPVP